MLSISPLCLPTYAGPTTATATEAEDSSTQLNDVMMPPLLEVFEEVGDLEEIPPLR